MLSVIVATRDSERPLVRTLAALVGGATSGLITEVLIADGGSRDDTPAVADIAGCKLLADDDEPLGRRLRTAAAAARAPWLMFLQPGIVLDTPWIGEMRSFVERPVRDQRAAVFRRAWSGHSALAEAAALVAAALGARPRPEQGLVIAADFYHQTGGHSQKARDPEGELLRRIGGRRLARLSTRAFRSNT